MPTPIVHSAISVATLHAAARGRYRRGTLALFLLAANIPDLDVVPGLISGELMRFHHKPSHSFAFSIASALLSSAVAARLSVPGSRWASWKTWLPFFSLVCITHPLLDLLTYDPSGSYSPEAIGLALFWPFSHAVQVPLLNLFPGPVVSPDHTTWLSRRNVSIFGAEGLLSAAFLSTVFWGTALFRKPQSDERSDSHASG